MEFIFFYKGKLPSKANYKEIGYRRVNGVLKPFIRNKKNVLIYQNDAIYQLHNQILKYGYEKFPISSFVKLEIYFFLKNSFEKRDLDNLEKFLFDVLEKATIIKNDALIIKKHSEKIKYKDEGFLVKIKVVKRQNLSNKLIKIFDDFNISW